MPVCGVFHITSGMASKSGGKTAPIRLFLKDASLSLLAHDPPTCYERDYIPWCDEASALLQRVNQAMPTQRL